ncbi:MAG: Molybdenum-pterin-binding protein MopA [Herbaspirillum frisingense]|uniref:Molybdenum-pterin-binding protein MopA n=1 Tax=Herbaspirillum frisingense TaxID=92645 RepID=A0A7V8JVE3_9BURK|nr:MAG: Molybdenum-pterin-binding protein MopA [Herbaspirillum frisingense]
MLEASGGPCTITRMNYSKTIRLRVMQGDAIAFGPGKADLLQAIEHTGSISGAAREMEMSYRRAWLLVEEMNRCFVSPLVTTATGGARGAGAVVTDLGRDVLARYRRMQKKADASIAADLGHLRALMSGAD